MTAPCLRCVDGWIEYTGGTHATGGYWLNGSWVVREVEATPERPVYKRCSCQSTKGDSR